MQILRWNRSKRGNGKLDNQVGSSVLLNPVLHRFTGYCSA
ncbi:unnamed protein product [Callosobruchus maculatus]|uniref:Uncharacterized protein n=1 Tax=Callosobruchus maculatus TaxID=64391 RepID=A0A653BVR0_CALMS|nr:unnamed protein product [Callosobruchus maculatus]